MVACIRGWSAWPAPLALATGYAGYALLRDRRQRWRPLQTLAALPFLLWGGLKLVYPLLHGVGWYVPWGLAAEHLTAVATAVGLVLLTHRRLIARANRELAERFRSEQALRDNERGQALVADVSARLVTAPIERIDEQVRASLESLSGFLHYDRAALVLLSEDGTQAVPTDVIFRPGRDDAAQSSTPASLPWHFARFKVGEIIAAALARKRAVDALRRTAERFQLAVDGSQEGLWDWDMVGEQVWYSSVWRDMIGLSEEDMKTYPWSEYVHPDDLDTARQQMRAYFAGETAVYRSEYRHRHKDGRWIWIEARGACSRDQDGRPINFAGHMTDISDRKRAEAMLQQQTNYDHLALPRLAVALKATRQRRHKVAAIAIGGAEIERIATALGRGARDAALLEVSRRLNACLGGDNWLFRSSTYEFLAVLPNIATSSQVEQMALTLLETAHEPIDIGDQVVVVPLNAGITIAPTDGDTAPVMVRNAHAALLKARDSGGNTHSFFSPALRADGARRLAMRACLRYQPLIDARSGKLIGAEVLLRWDNPEFGTVRHDQFIPIAEESGLIVPIGEWVLRAACRQARGWQERTPERFRISVNVSPRQIRNGEIISAVRDALMQSGLPAGALELEITEGLIVDHAAETREVLEQLHDIGCRLTVDDFGTGYSSLSYLQRFPFDALKIDQSFVRSLPDKPSDVTLVTAIIAMAKGLGLKVTGEGVETSQQMRFLRAHGCDVVQGYLFGQPLTAEAFEALFEGSAGGNIRLGDTADGLDLKH